MLQSLKLKPGANVSFIPCYNKRVHLGHCFAVTAVHMSPYSFDPAVVKTGITHVHTHTYTGTVARRDTVRFSVRPRNSPSKDRWRGHMQQPLLPNYHHTYREQDRPTDKKWDKLKQNKRRALIIKWMGTLSLYCVCNRADCKYSLPFRCTLDVWTKWNMFVRWVRDLHIKTQDILSNLSKLRPPYSCLQHDIRIN